MKTNPNAFDLPPVHNPDLEKVITDLKNGSTPELQTALVNTLKKATLLSPCDFDVKFDGKKMPKNFTPQQIKFFLLNTNDGKTFFPAFTDMEMSTKISLGPDVKPQYVVRTIKDYDALLSAEGNKAAGIVINPGADNIIIPLQMVAMISGRTPAPSPVNNQTAPMNVSYREPNVYPTRMVNAIYDLAEKNEDISRIWLKGKYTGPRMCFYLVVEAKKQDEAVLNSIREVAVPLAKDIDVEVVFVTPEIKEKVIGDAVALYDKDLVL